jgi:hypothetical protein
MISIGRGKEEKGTKEEAFKRLFGVNRELGEKMKSILQNEFDELHKQGSSPTQVVI